MYVSVCVPETCVLSPQRPERLAKKDDTSTWEYSKFFFGAAEVEMMNAIMHITYGSRRLQRISRQTYTPDLTQAFLYEIEM